MSMKYKSSTPYGGLSERRALSCLNLSPLTTSLLTPRSDRLAANDYSRLYTGTGSRRKPKSPARKLEFASSTKVVGSRVEHDKSCPDSISGAALASSASNNTENHSFVTTIMKAVGMIFSGLFLGIVALFNIAYSLITAPTTRGAVRLVMAKKGMIGMKAKFGLALFCVSFCLKFIRGWLNGIRVQDSNRYGR